MPVLDISLRSEIGAREQVDSQFLDERCLAGVHDLLELTFHVGMGKNMHAPWDQPRLKSQL